MTPEEQKRTANEEKQKRIEFIEQRKIQFFQTEKPWWELGEIRNSNGGWVAVYKKDDWKCVYCLKDLTSSTDALSESTQDHLVPKYLLDDKKCNHLGNLVPCCAACNALKSSWMPVENNQWGRRCDYIDACKKQIALKKYENFEKYKIHIETVLKERAGLSSSESE